MSHFTPSNAKIKQSFMSQYFRKATPPQPFITPEENIVSTSMQDITPVRRDCYPMDDSSVDCMDVLNADAHVVKKLPFKPPRRKKVKFELKAAKGEADKTMVEVVVIDDCNHVTIMSDLAKNPTSTAKEKLPGNDVNDEIDIPGNISTVLDMQQSGVSSPVKNDDAGSMDDLAIPKSDCINRVLTPYTDAITVMSSPDVMSVPASSSVLISPPSMDMPNALHAETCNEILFRTGSDVVVSPEHECAGSAQEGSELISSSNSSSDAFPALVPTQVVDFNLTLESSTPSDDKTVESGGNRSSRKRKNSTKSDDAATEPASNQKKAGSKKASGPSKEELIALLSMDDRKLYDCCAERQGSLLQELADLERSKEFSEELTIATAATWLRTLLMQGPSSSSNTSAQNNAETSGSVPLVHDTNTSNALIENALCCLSARFIEGSELPLSQLVIVVAEKVRQTVTFFSQDNIGAISNNNNDDNNNNNSLDSSIVIGDLSEAPAESGPISLALVADVQDCITTFLDCVRLGETIKRICERRVLGARDKVPAVASLFEDGCARAVLRWHVIDLSKLPEAVAASMKDVRATRLRYGRAIKASVHVGELLLSKVAGKDVADTVRARADEEAARTLKDVELAKSRRIEAIRKKEKAEEERQKREDEKEKRRLQREEEQRLKDEAKEKAADEKRALEASKQQEKKLPSILSFLKPVATATGSAATAVAGRPRPREALGAHITIDGPSPSAAQESSAGMQVDDECALTCATTSTMPADETVNQRHREFEALVLRGDAMELSDVWASYRARFSQKAASITPNKSSRTIRRGRVAITVSVVSANTSGMFSFDEAANQNIELREVELDGRMRLFSFHEDFRPPYWGTFSKRSAVITGRRPFGKDSQMDYDYDSEAEWEEGDDPDAEDIAMSDGEEDGNEEGNELEYDEFFRHDDDFGSDAGSDGGMVAAAAINPRRLVSAVELIGPIFIGPSAESGLVRLVNGQPELCADNLRIVGDAVKLRNYSAFVYGPLNSLPELGVTTSAAPEPLRASTAERVTGSEPGASSVANEGDVKGSKPGGFRAELLPELIRHVHGRRTGIEKLVEEFWTLHTELVRAQIRRKIQSIAAWTKPADGLGTARWLVEPEHCEGVELPPIDLGVATKTKAKQKSGPKASTSAIAAATGTTSVLTLLASAGSKEGSKRKLSEMEDVSGVEVLANETVGRGAREPEVVVLGDEDDVKASEPTDITATTTTTAPSLPRQANLFKFFSPCSESSSGVVEFSADLDHAAGDSDGGVEECKEGPHTDVLELDVIYVKGVGLTRPAS